MLKITPADLTKVMREIPDALRPTWLDETWSGVHGAGGLRAEVENVSSSMKITPHGITGSSNANGYVMNRSSEVGTFTRDQTLHEGGRLEVHHSYLRLDDSAQGSGFARAFNDRAFARYAEAGVDDVTIHAALSVGAYAWARQGFDLVGSGATAGERMISRARTVTNLIESAKSRSAITPAQYETLAPRLYHGGELQPEALISVGELAAMPEIGKAVLLGRSWHGARPIERTQAWWVGRAPGGLDAARTGVSHISMPQEVATASGAAARRISARLPAALDPSMSSRVFERALTDVGGGAVVDASIGAATTLKLGAGDRVAELANRFQLRTDSGDEIRLAVLHQPSGALIGSEYMSPTLVGDDTRHALDSGWRELGIDKVMDRSNGDAVRSVGLA